MADASPIILTAVRMEQKAIQQTLLQRGLKNVRVECLGIGAKHFSKLSDLPSNREVWLCGLAGALDPRLAVADVVVDGELSTANSRREVWRGKIVCASEIVSSPEKKAELFIRTNALAVDMESDAVRAWTGDHGLQFLHIRAISDRADETLDPRVLGLVDEMGNPKPLSLAKALAGSPTLMPYLVKLGKNSKLALANLADVVVESVLQKRS